MYFRHICSHHTLKPPLVLSPYSTSFTHTFLIVTPSISHFRHDTNYTTEPPTVSTIFPTLSHYDHLQVLPVNVSNILVLSIIISTIFSSLLHYEHPPVLSETIMIIIFTFIIIIIIIIIITH